MNLKTSVSHEVDKDWNLQLLKNDSSTTYQTSNWAQVYQKVYGSTPVFILVEKPNGEIVAQLTAVIHNRYFWIKSNLLTQTLGIKLNLRTYIDWFYGPIIYDDSLADSVLKEILLALEKLAKNHKATMMRGVFHPSLKSTTFIRNSNDNTDMWSTYVIDLSQNVELLYNSLNKKTRYDIRKAEKNDLTFKVADERGDLDQYLNLKYESIMRGGGKIIVAHKRREKLIQDFNDAHWTLLHKKGLEKLFLVKYNDDILGGITCFTFNKNMYQHGVGNSSKTELLGGSFLTWNSIKWGVSNNFLKFDLGGVNPHPSSVKEQQIDFYKKKWGGQKLDYVIYTKIFNKLKVNLGTILGNPQLARRKISQFLRKGV
jgi:hypothetical protein